MAFNMVSVGTTDAEKEELLAGVGKCRKRVPGNVVASAGQDKAAIVPVKALSAYGSTFPYNKSQGTGAVKAGEDEY